MAARAFLVDLYETLITCDYTAHAQVIPAMAGVDPDVWQQHAVTVAPLVSTGELSLAAGFERLLVTSGRRPDRGLIARMLDHDQASLMSTVHVYPDAVPFLRRLRDSGIRTALVSNCADNTRPLLEHIGLPALVDALVLSCEVGAAKPDPHIYLAALDELDVVPGHATFVDDQPSYCDAAVELGMHAVRVQRGDTDQLADGAVRSLLDIALD